MPTTDNYNEVEQYKSAVKLMSYDGSIMWHIMRVFLLPQSIILTYLLTTPFARAVMRTIDNAKDAAASAENIGPLLFEWNPQIIPIALFCFVLCIPWYFLCNRSIASYDFSATNARYLEPKGWKLIGGERTRYFDGKEVNIGRKSLRLKWHGKMKIRRTSHIIVWMFAVTFLALVVVSLRLSKIIDILREAKMTDAWLIVVIVGVICSVLVVGMEYLRRMAVIKEGEKRLVNMSKEGLLISGSVMLAVGLSFLSTRFFVKLEGWLWLLGSLFSFIGIALIVCFVYKECKIAKKNLDKSQKGRTNKQILAFVGGIALLISSLIFCIALVSSNMPIWAIIVVVLIPVIAATGFFVKALLTK